MNLSTIIISLILILIVIKIVRYLIANPGCQDCSSKSGCHGSCKTTGHSLVEEYHSDHKHI